MILYNTKLLKLYYVILSYSKLYQVILSNTRWRDGGIDGEVEEKIDEEE